ncbi:MAG TPA: hypothetical protein VGQ92_01065, partial [Actinoplanes sp.]|nr:hypothetical protein [Actinoplanes sp.]
MPKAAATTAAGALVVVFIAIGAGEAGMFDPIVSQAIDDAAQFLGALAAVACCLWTAPRYSGGQRAWRLWLAFGMTGWSIGQLISSYN